MLSVRVLPAKAAHVWAFLPEGAKKMHSFGSVTDYRVTVWFQEKMDEAKIKVWDYEYVRMVDGRQCQNIFDRRKKKENQASEIYEDRVLRQRPPDVDIGDGIFDEESWQELKNRIDNGPESERIANSAQYEKAKHRLEWIGIMTKTVKEVFKNKGKHV